MHIFLSAAVGNLSQSYCRLCSINKNSLKIFKTRMLINMPDHWVVCFCPQNPKSLLSCVKNIFHSCIVCAMRLRFQKMEHVAPRKKESKKKKAHNVYWEHCSFQKEKNGFCSLPPWLSFLLRAAWNYPRFLQRFFISISHYLQRFSTVPVAVESLMTLRSLSGLNLIITLQIFANFCW